MNSRLLAVCPAAMLLFSLAHPLQTQLVGSSALSIDPSIAINDQGWIAFTARDSTASKVFLCTAPGVYNAISFSSSNRTFGGVGISSGSTPVVAARDLVSGAPPTYLLRTWDPTFSTYNLLGTSPGDWDSVGTSCDVNDFGVVADYALIGGSTATALVAGNAKPLTQLAVYSGAIGLRPQIANTGDVVIRDNIGRIIAWNYPSGAATFIAGTSNGFDSATGKRPGISKDGQVVAFTGNRMGAGVFVSFPGTSGRTLVPVAGEISGYAFSSFQDETRTGVYDKVIDPNHREIGVCYVGTQNGVLGLYRSTIDVLFDVPSVNPPVKIAMVGDTLPGLSGTITGFSLYNPMNSKGQVAVWASLSDGNAAILVDNGQTTLYNYIYGNPNGSNVFQVGPYSRPSYTRWSGHDGRRDAPYFQGFWVHAKGTPGEVLFVYDVPKDESGFHFHNDTPRPHGFICTTLPISSGPNAKPGETVHSSLANAFLITVPPSGEALFYYLAPDIAGIETLHVGNQSGRDDQLTITVKEAEFVQLPDPMQGGTYKFNNDDDSHPGNKAHKHNRFSGTPQLVTAIQALAQNYFAQTKSVLPVNDMSLTWGGLVDTTEGSYWDYVHKGHRFGTEVDIALAYPNPIFEQILGNQGWWLIDPGLWQSENTTVVSGTPAATGLHYHLRLSELPGTPTMLAPANTLIASQASPGRWSGSIILMNRGGIAATDVQITSVQVSQPAIFTLDTPLNTSGGPAAILGTVPVKFHIDSSSQSVTVKVTINYQAFSALSGPRTGTTTTNVNCTRPGGSDGGG